MREEESEYYDAGITNLNAVCPKCKKDSSEQYFHIVDAKTTNEYGEGTGVKILVQCECGATFIIAIFRDEQGIQMKQSNGKTYLFNQW